MVRATRKKPRHNLFWRDVNEILLYGHHTIPYTQRRPFHLKQRGGKGVIQVGDKHFHYYNEDQVPINTQNTQNTNSIFSNMPNENNYVYNSDRYVIRGEKVDGSMPCFILHIIHTAPQPYAYLLNITKGTSCSLEDNATSADIVCAVVQLAKEKGAKWIELTDESKICKDELRNIPSISLANYYFLTRGKTWYETILPFIPEDKKIEEYRNKVLTNSWNFIMSNLKRINIGIANEIIHNFPVNISHIDTTKAGSAMTILSMIPPNVRCSFYHKYMSYLITASDIFTINGTVWSLPLTDEKIICPSLTR